MKWITFTTAGDDRRVGVLNGDVVHALDTTRTLTELISGGAEELAAAGSDALRSPAAVHALDEVRLEAPITPPQMRDAMCFHEHIRNCMGDVDPRHEQYPAFYISNSAAVLGPVDDVPVPPGCDRFDFELEVAAVIGKGGFNIAPDAALSHVIGFTTYIDWSARDLQMDEMGLALGPAKGKDTHTTLGPCLVTADEFADRRAGKGFDIEMYAEVNGERIGGGNWSTIDWSVDDVISYVGRGTTLRPGEVVGFGTVGTGCLYEHFHTGSDRFTDWLRPGDRVNLEIELIGRTDQLITERIPRHPLSTGH